ncbi:hypothetical protein NKH18_22470 [Streptomyces sp. M10(2022)]
MPKTGGSAEDYQRLVTLLDQAASKPASPIDRLGPKDLDDGQLIIAYDAMTMAVHGIRQATAEGRNLPEPADVGGQWSLLKGSLKVSGASGWICLDNHGNPYNKAVPVVELTPTGEQRFVKTAWPGARRRTPAVCRRRHPPVTPDGCPRPCSGADSHRGPVVQTPA